MLTPSTVKQHISSKGADPDAAFRVLPSSFVPPQARRVLVEHLEREHTAKPEEDLKLNALARGAGCTNRHRPCRRRGT